MRNKIDLIILVSDLSSALDAAVKAGKINESDFIKIDHSYGSANKIISSLLDYAKERRGESGYNGSLGEVKNG